MSVLLCARVRKLATIHERASVSFVVYDLGLYQLWHNGPFQDHVVSHRGEVRTALQTKMAGSAGEGLWEHLQDDFKSDTISLDCLQKAREFLLKKTLDASKAPIQMLPEVLRRELLFTSLFQTVLQEAFAGEYPSLLLTSSSAAAGDDLGQLGADVIREEVRLAVETHLLESLRAEAARTGPLQQGSFGDDSSKHAGKWDGDRQQWQDLLEGVRTRLGERQVRTAAASENPFAPFALYDGERSRTDPDDPRAPTDIGLGSPAAEKSRPSASAGESLLLWRSDEISPFLHNGLELPLPPAEKTLQVIPVAPLGTLEVVQVKDVYVTEASSKFLAHWILTEGHDSLEAANASRTAFHRMRFEMWLHHLRDVNRDHGAASSGRLVFADMEAGPERQKEKLWRKLAVLRDKEGDLFYRQLIGLQNLEAGMPFNAGMELFLLYEKLKENMRDEEEKRLDAIQFEFARTMHFEDPGGGLDYEDVVKEFVEVNELQCLMLSVMGARAEFRRGFDYSSDDAIRKAMPKLQGMLERGEIDQATTRSEASAMATHRDWRRTEDGINVGMEIMANVVLSGQRDEMQNEFQAEILGNAPRVDQRHQV